MRGAAEDLGGGGAGRGGVGWGAGEGVKEIKFLAPSLLSNSFEKFHTFSKALIVRLYRVESGGTVPLHCVVGQWQQRKVFDGICAYILFVLFAFVTG